MHHDFSAMFPRSCGHIWGSEATCASHTSEWSLRRAVIASLALAVGRGMLQEGAGGNYLKQLTRRPHVLTVLAEGAETRCGEEGAVCGTP